MNTVAKRSRHSARSTARDLRALMREQQITVGTLAWIIRCSRTRAAGLRIGSSSWRVDEVLRLVEACAPASASVPVWGVFAERAAA